MNRHHRKPRWYNGSDEKWNVISVDERRHAAFHFLFRVITGRGSGCRPMTPEEIGEDLSKTWIDPSYIIEVRKKEP